MRSIVPGISMTVKGMANAKLHSRGFTLIASSLMLLLLSGIAIGLMLMVNTEGKVGSTDLQNNGSFHAAEGGIEKMAADLNAVFQDAQAPTAAEICGLSGPPLGSAANEPALAGVTWTQYSVMPGNTQGTVCPSQAAFLQMEKNNWNQIISGPEQG
jgi:Tfp pilus assembly protein PilX